jgi:ATP-dependent helicase/nuclease subunit A
LAETLSSPERRERCLAAIMRRNLADLVEGGLLTQAFNVSGNAVRGKKRELFAAEINEVEHLVRAFVNRTRLARLNREGGAHYELFRYYRSLRDHLKRRASIVEFADLAKGCFRLFRGDAGLGVRFLIARTTRHVLLDEFQDTSRLQWAIFHELAAQLLAGESEHAGDAGPPPSVFIVGDEKQSIYGFREADPAVLGDAAAALAER